MHLAIVSTWIAGTIAFYVAVALVCRRLRPHDLMVWTYAAVRKTVSGRRWWLWYVLLFLGTIAAASGGLALGIALARLGPVWQVAVAGVSALAVGYAALTFWPSRDRLPRPRAALVGAAGALVALLLTAAYLFAIMHWPNWLVLGIGTYALAVPPLVWFRAVRPRTAICLLAASTVYDVIHVFGTDWMDTFMDSIAKTPGVLRLPDQPRLDAPWFFSIGHGDILAPGILVVIAARATDPRQAAWLVSGAALGAAAGHALAVVVTLAINRTLPALIVLVPMTCLGYGAAFAAVRLRQKTKPLAAAVVPQGAE